MSKKFTLTGFVFCSMVALFYLWCWIRFIVSDEECPNSVMFITLASAFVAGMYGFMYRIKKQNEKQQEDGSNKRPKETIE